MLHSPYCNHSCIISVLAFFFFLIIEIFRMLPKCILIIQWLPANLNPIRILSQHCWPFLFFYLKRKRIKRFNLTPIYRNVCKILPIDRLPHTRKWYKTLAILWSSSLNALRIFRIVVPGVRWMQHNMIHRTMRTGKMWKRNQRCNRWSKQNKKKKRNVVNVKCVKRICLLDVPCIFVYSIQLLAICT